MAKTKQEKISSKSNSAATLVFPPSIYVGPLSAASDAAFVNSNSITHALSIGATPSAQIPGVTYHRLALVDSVTASISKVTDEAVKIIDSVVATESEKILIHCSAAVSRSPTIVTAYLMIRQKMLLKEALGRVIIARPTVSPNPNFLRQLKDLEEKLYGCVTLDVEELPKKREDRQNLFKSYTP
ncbi:protein-tyrosine phosphatase-like protein [Xylogone sp. PMI_703]|nr:protein-tyrosine phosphatase-like protein [Xylogone sp. PMI_703]